jgi:serine protease Do
MEQLTGWVPESGGWLFESGRPYTISSDQHDFFGRNESLTVQFPGTRIGINASLLRTSIEADVAEIKIDVDSPVDTLDLAERGQSREVGEKSCCSAIPACRTRHAPCRKPTKAAASASRISIFRSPR